MPSTNPSSFSLSGERDHAEWFMSIPRCFTYDDGSVFVSEHHQSTLLDVVNILPSAITK